MFLLLIVCVSSMLKQQGTIQLFSLKKPPTKLPHIQRYLRRFFGTSDCFHIAPGICDGQAASKTQKKLSPRPRSADTSILLSDGAFSISTPEASICASSHSAIISPYDITQATFPESLSFPQTLLKISFIFQEREKAFNTFEHLRIFGVYRKRIRPRPPTLITQRGHFKSESFNILEHVRDIAPLSVMRYFLGGSGTASLPISSSPKYPLIIYTKGRYTQLSFDGSESTATSLKNGAIAIIPPGVETMLSISQNKDPSAYLSIFLVTFTNSGYFPGFLSG
jgi:hypothetical protein